MPTGDKVYNIFDKRVMTKAVLEVDALNFIRNQVVGEVLGFLTRGAGGSDTRGESFRMGRSGPTLVNATTPPYVGRIIANANPNRIQVKRGGYLTGEGRVINQVSDEFIDFHNVLSTKYWFGTKAVDVVDSAGGSVIANPRISGQFEYDHFIEERGEVEDPNDVFDDGDSTLTIVIDSVTEALVDHSIGTETVRIWLKQPVSNTTWFEDLTVQFGTDPGPGGPRWTGSKNFVQSTGTLGQGGSPSTTAADYTVWHKGISWFTEGAKNLGTDGANRSTYVVHGGIVGSGTGNGTVSDDIDNRPSPIFMGLQSVSNRLPAPNYFGAKESTWTTLAANSTAIRTLNYRELPAFIINKTAAERIRYIMPQLLLHDSGTSKASLLSIGMRDGWYISDIEDTAGVTGAIEITINRGLGSPGTDPDQFQARIWWIDDQYGNY